MHDYIPSFMHTDLVSNAVIKEGIYWGRYYSFLFCNGILNFVDIRQPFAPLYRYGIFDKLSYKKRLEFKKFNFRDVRILQNDEFDLVINDKVIEESLSKGANVLEIGCGSGWLSLELRRKGFNVIGLDPSFQCLRIAKRYAISRGHYIEYFQADASLPIFRNDIFDGVFAFHSLHHIQIHQVAKNIKRWLKKSGVISIYEHRYSSRLFGIVKSLIYYTFLLLNLLVTHNYPKEILSQFGEGSPNEDISINQIDHFAKDYDIVKRELYFHFLDDLPCLMYFIFRRNEKVLKNFAGIINLLQGRMRILFPHKAEFVHYIGFNTKGFVSSSGDNR
ncbi:MAG: class I SAM-dependent methyltransferase [Candidatus Bathyarchaeia archaeon]